MVAVSTWMDDHPLDGTGPVACIRNVHVQYHERFSREHQKLKSVFQLGLFL